MDDTVRELHHDLARKYRLHGPQIQQIWTSIGQEQREQVLRAGSRNGELLTHPGDTSLGNVCKIIPEWNVRDLVKQNCLLDLLEIRATTPLQTQYTGEDDGPKGDHAHIVDMMQSRNLKHTNASNFVDCYTLFISEENYGESIRVTASKKGEILAQLRHAIEAQLIIPQAVGELVLMRQLHLLQSLNIIIEDILDLRQKPENSKKRSKGPDDIGTRAMAKLSLHTIPKKTTLSDLAVEVLDKKSSMDDRVDLLITEPIVLAHDVNFWFFSRPELIPDERGRALPAHTDRHISAAVFDAVHSGVKAVAVWDYTYRLVGLLHELPRNSTSAFVLHELSAVCRMEYSRAQTTFRRAVSVGLGGSRWIKRMSTTKKDGFVRTSVKEGTDVLLRTDPQLYYMLQLCHDSTTYTQAAQWIQKLEDLHRAHPLEKDKLAQHELDTLSDLAVAVTFIQSLSSLVKLPSVGQKRQGQGFAAECSLLADRISQLRAGIDLGDFAIPIDNLLQPGRAASALTKLSEYVIEKLGADIISLYKDLVQAHVAKVQQQQEYYKKQIRDSQADYVTPYIAEALEASTEQRKDKRKIASGPPIEVSSLERTDTVGTLSDHPIAKPDAFQVKYDTFAVFSLLLSKPSAARGSVSWHAFTSAMADLGFSIIPKFGSIFTFIPPHSVAVQKRLTLHRPHQSNLEQFHLLSYSRRLKTVYGWGESTFVGL